MKMDWKSLGYERQYKDGKLKWVPAKDYYDLDNKDTPA